MGFALDKGCFMSIKLKRKINNYNHFRYKSLSQRPENEIIVTNLGFSRSIILNKLHSYTKSEVAKIKDELISYLTKNKCTPFVSEEFKEMYPDLLNSFLWFKRGPIEFEFEASKCLKFEFWIKDHKYPLTNRKRGFSSLNYLEVKTLHSLQIAIVNFFFKKGFLMRANALKAPQYAYDQVAIHKFSSCHWPEDYPVDNIFCQLYSGKKTRPENYNCRSKDGNHIKNGEIKYFYDRNRKLQRGIISHNINNMWWVILNNYEYRNVASFELFDFVSLEETPLKRQNLGDIKADIKLAVNEENYLKAHYLQQLFEKKRVEDKKEEL